MPIVDRPFEAVRDWDALRAMLVECFALDGPPDYATVGDIDWWRSTEDDPDALTGHIWLDEATGRVLALAWLAGDQVDLLVHPRHRDLEAAMLGWAESAAPAAGGHEPRVLHAWSYQGDRTRVALLERRGYARDGDGLNYRIRALDDVSEPALPTGYAIRNVAGDDDLEPRVAVHRAAFDGSRMSAAKHRQVMAAPTYRPDLDLVVVAPDGDFAAYCIVWLDTDNRLGVFEPVGCATAHRRKGLASAVMQEGMRRARALGATRVCVVCAAGDEGANRLYDALGFARIDTNERWRRELT